MAILGLMKVTQNSTDPIPLYVPSASGNYGGDPSLSGLTVTLQAAGGSETLLGGKVIPGKRGAYWYYPQAGDFANVGRYLLFLNGLPGADVPLPFEVDLEAAPPQPAAQTINMNATGTWGVQDSENLAALLAAQQQTNVLLGRIAAAERAP